MPADHLIRDQRAFAAAVARAAELAQAGTLVTFGITPTHPETGFGYIECGDMLAPQWALRRRVSRAALRREAAARARARVSRRGPLRVELRHVRVHADAILAAFARHAPGVLAAARPRRAGARRARESTQMLEIDAALFAAVPDISIDYAVMEPAAEAGEVAVVRGAFDWSDVGSWQAVAELSDADADGNRGHGERVAIATRGTYVHAADRIVATVGVENLVIVDTPDAVLVAHRDHLQRVKEVVGELKARGHDAYKLHRTVSRPWGAYTVLEEGPGLQDQAHRSASPGAALSLQLHHRRSEHWVVVRGTARVTQRRARIRRASRTSRRTFRSRRAIGSRTAGVDPLVMIEVQCGDYLGEDDIVRFDDKYGRAPAQAS